MSRAIHVFRSPDRFVAGTVGQPGDRTFYLQAVHEARIISVMLEKQQVQILADRIGALLDEIHRRFGTPIPPPSDRVGDLSPLVMPVDAEFRVGTMGLGWDAESEAVVVELLAITEGEFDESVVLDDTDEGPDAVRVFLTTQAAREFAARSSRVISAGRPPCPLCAEPLDPAGHLCVRTNGFKRDAELSKSIEFVDPEVFRDLSLGDDSGPYDTDDEGDDSADGPDAEGPGRD
ncbi:DUF3090 domain-containing protein [Gordonia sputi]|uniref:DUF3090 domain-containing protein n=1 Tax=Gordonia sputi TaxID=36823 RepID=UPI002043DD54|nr:DUF3090 domain-containing protein [Gordonia sputi]MCM3897192.1 DUF3090 domain-containing protein [Gordonia sputi]